MDVYKNVNTRFCEHRTQCKYCSNEKYNPHNQIEVIIVKIKQLSGTISMLFVLIFRGKTSTKCIFIKVLRLKSAYVNRALFKGLLRENL